MGFWFGSSPSVGHKMWTVPLGRGMCFTECHSTLCCFAKLSLYEWFFICLSVCLSVCLHRTFVFLSATACQIETIFSIDAATHVECCNDNYDVIGHVVWQPYCISLKPIKIHHSKEVLVRVCNLWLLFFLVSSVVTGVREGRSVKILNVNVYHVAPPGCGGRGYYKSVVEITCIFALYMSRESGKHQSQPSLIREAGGGEGRREGKGREGKRLG